MITITNPPQTKDRTYLTWHRKLKGDRTCTICGCAGRHIGEHRKIPESEHASHFWEKGKKTPSGWNYFAIGDRREMEIQEAREEGRRQRAKRTGKPICRKDLLTFFYEKFLPKRGPELSPWTIERYRRAVAEFVRFAGTDVIPVATVSERMTEQFREWLLTSGVGIEAARQHFTYVRAIVRAGRPKAFPLRFNGRARTRARQATPPSMFPAACFPSQKILICRKK